MNYKHAFTFIFEDDKWLSKVLIGIGFALIWMLIIPMLISLGYLIEITEKVIRKEKGLPEWNNWGPKISKSLAALGLWLVLGFLPMVIVFAPLFIFAGEFLTANQDTIQQVYVALTSAILLPFIIVHVARAHGNMEKAIQIKDFFVLIENNVSRLLIVALLSILLAAITYFVQVFTKGLLTPYISNTLGVSLIIGLVPRIIFPGLIPNFYLHHLYGQIGVAVDKENPEQLVADKA